MKSLPERCRPKSTLNCPPEIRSSFLLCAPVAKGHGSFFVRVLVLCCFLYGPRFLVCAISLVVGHESWRIVVRWSICLEWALHNDCDFVNNYKELYRSCITILVAIRFR